MADQELIIRCQRCGDAMEMKDPAPGEPWRPDQFWVCPRCGRHFWTTYANPPGTPAPAKAAAPAQPKADAPATPKADAPAKATPPKAEG